MSVRQERRDTVVVSLAGVVHRDRQPLAKHEIVCGMTNHGDTTGSPDKHGIDTPGIDGQDTHNRDTTARSRPDRADHPHGAGGTAGPPAGTLRGHTAHGTGDAVPLPRRSPARTAHGALPVTHIDCAPYDTHSRDHQVTLRTPAELADALPYLLGYRPEDSVVLLALHDRGGRGRFGGRARLGIPAATDDWPAAARQLAHGLITGSERRGAKPEQMVAYLCQEPGKGETGRQVMERLRPLAQRLRVECGSLDVPVIEALCISDGRFWSYCCPGGECCPPEGQSMGLPGTSVLAAAATYAGLQVRGTLGELRGRLMPWQNASALAQEVALDAASLSIVPRVIDPATRAGVAEETLSTARQVMERFAKAPAVSGILTEDLRDDQLLDHDEAATLIVGLQDRTTRDRAAEWMEGDEGPLALRLWRALARRCVGPYGEHAAAPLTLAGWVAWSTGDELEAREALAMALAADPDYLFARLLHQACNEGLDPESIRRCLRAERDTRTGTGAAEGHEGVGAAVPGPGGDASPRGKRDGAPAEGSRTGGAAGVRRAGGVGGGTCDGAVAGGRRRGSGPVGARPPGTATGGPKAFSGRVVRQRRRAVRGAEGVGEGDE